MNKIHLADERLSRRPAASDLDTIILLSDEELRLLQELMAHLNDMYKCQTGVIKLQYFNEESVVQATREALDSAFIELTGAIARLRGRTHILTADEIEKNRRQDEKIMKHANQFCNTLQDMGSPSDSYLVYKIADLIQQHCALHDAARRDLARLTAISPLRH